MLQNSMRQCFINWMYYLHQQNPLTYNLKAQFLYLQNRISKIPCRNCIWYSHWYFPYVNMAIYFVLECHVFEQKGVRNEYKWFIIE